MPQMERNQTVENLQRSDSPGNVGRAVATAMGIYLIVLIIVLAYLVYELWPPQLPDDKEKVLEPINLFRNTIKLEPSYDERLILIVMVVGALGSYIHAATSFADYIGNRTFITSWIWWYILRPFIGMALALIFYFVLRGGLLSAGAEAGDISTFGIAAVAGLVGMFSKQATDKLNELFDTLFMTEKGKGDDARKDKLKNLAPVITGIDRQTIPSGSGEVTVEVNGSNFVEKSVVQANGVSRNTKFLSAAKLSAQLLSEDTAARGSITVTVFNPPPGGGTSNSMKIEIQ
jgi:hypothetical protein